jgi:hypothetical protein
MADAVASQTLVDGPKNTVMKFTNASDGTGESAVLKVDVSTLNAAPNGTPTRVKVNRIHYTTSGMAVRLLWDATTDVTMFELGADQTGCLDFTAFGGLINNGGTGVTGDIMLTTIGHAAGDSYTLVLEMIKD